MTLLEIIELIKTTALNQPNVNSAVEGDLYDYMNANPSIDYSVVFLTQQSHRETEGFMHYSFYIFYCDRLQSDLDSNRALIQSTGLRVLSNIIRTVCDNLDIEVPDVTYVPYSQRFADEVAGVYASVEFTVPIEDVCAEEY